MAASNSTLHSPTTPNTTFVQANPSNFRAVVQKLTGASDDPSAHKLPLTLPTRLAAAQSHRLASAGEVIGPKKPNFKLHERRNAAAKRLELPIDTAMSMMMMSVSPTSSLVRSRTTTTTLVASPVSPLELFLARASPRTPHEEEEERAIAEKGFYLHPSPRASQPPELLPLFPLHSPTHNHNHNHTTNSPSIPN
ncbi:hypothetical protein JHK82_017379 [Glycine max]|uniref:VQ motif-containing protein 11 n=1 Tax=Glycine soja TaxID=3848 RepID=A0A445JRI5_GLYSO|nr:VQ motif-containing protein 11-like [Glycine soja]KAG5021478.1 hypothetical protein JHK85_017820 [Glycine max]KAG5008812.1 hypothetical protein JHK87_017327 [Glycine soja]KAG5036596.1 hypothetical protein JHK86_017436 [Glycine max]KAG5141684.1 hypothetical protein JHK82_017379 [Glycine max]KAH1240430.1 VQ motif-containing protein 11 [Glycine max]